MNVLKTITAIFLLIGISVSTTAQSLNQELTNKEGDKYLIGQCDRNGLQKEGYNEWYSKNYENYSPDAAIVKKGKKKVKKMKIEIFMGTWCGDSKRGVPQFYKVLDELGVDEENVTLINLDNDSKRYKQSPTGEEKGKLIHRVPTFIFYDDGEEIGRIVETPITSYEMDIAQIVNGLPSEPNYKLVNITDRLLSKMDTLPTSKKDLLSVARIIQFDRKNSSELNNYGYLLMGRGELEKAISVFRINAMLYSKVPNVFDSLGEAYENANDFKNALIMYEQVLKLDPKHENAQKKVKELASKSNT